MRLSPGGAVFLRTAFIALYLLGCASAPAQEDKSQVKDPFPLEEPWVEALPVPYDPELEQQIQEVQESISTLHEQMVRRKAALEQALEPGEEGRIREELSQLKHERDALEKMLHNLVDEARASEWTKIDEALKRTRRLDILEDRKERKEEAVRDKRDEELQ
ncbi:MAG: hypothetical protein HYY14_00785 [Candidatus Omnitrophica bacterium]|nr:hypothetical protein [Candidatus Omnitrophota bacterium]